MQSFFIYILEAGGCVGVAWLFYKAILENKTRIRNIRLYFLIALVFSLLIPLCPIAIQVSFFEKTGHGYSENRAPYANSSNADEINTLQGKIIPAHAVNGKGWDGVTVLFYGYIIITAFFALRLGGELYAIIRCYLRSPKERWNNLHIVWNDKYKASFSFFGLIFINKNHVMLDELGKVLAHEKVHATQYHSADVLLIHLATALLWFNPFVWAMRNAVQLVHEYLADEGVLAAGIDKVQYQQSLLDHIMESRLLSITSDFKHSLIKKRFLMMSAKKSSSVSKYRILVLMPAATLMLLGVACVNGQTITNSSKVVTAVALTKSNVIYIGIENPVNISVSGYPANAIQVAIDNGAIAGESGEYIIKPARPGKALVTIKAGGKTVRETELRVKYLPPPVVALALPAGSSSLIKGGRITKEALLNAGGVITTIENADIDLPIKVSSFTLSTITNNNAQGMSVATSGDRFSADQVKLIQSLKRDQRIIIDDITAAGPDGRSRRAPTSMVFTLE